jgi:hypothetical protein
MTSLITANNLIEKQLLQCLQEVEVAVGSDVLLFCGPIVYGADEFIRDAVEGFVKKTPRLSLILETNGGYIEVAQRIADTLRHHYSVVDFFIPDHAMSAGTVLVMSGDSIYMDYYSVLGPIDPQLPKPDGGMIPVLGYLEQYKRLIAKSAKGTLTTAELAFLVQKFDPAELYKYEQASELSVSLLKEWLVKYKFKNWKTTSTHGKAVTPAMKKKRAEDIARALNRTDKWNSHGRGISMEVLRSEDIKLQIEDFGADARISQALRTYHKLIKDYASKVGSRHVLHTRDGFNWIG